MKEGIRKAKRLLAAWAFLICGAVLLMASGFHRLQLDLANPDPYTTSPWVAVELAFIMLMLLILLVHVVRLVVLAFQKRWRDLGILALKTVVGVACMVAALHIDAPTLLYRT